ncbi:MAG TPA: nuclear transport factor 2 family protein [Nitrospiria bacterium]
MEIFYSGRNVEDLRELFSDGFSFTGPFAQYSSADDYISALKADPPRDVHYKIIKSFENESSACLLYEFSKPGMTIPMAQLFEVRDGKISRIILVFDRAVFT